MASTTLSNTFVGHQSLRTSRCIQDSISKSNVPDKFLADCSTTLQEPWIKHGATIEVLTSYVKETAFSTISSKQTRIRESQLERLQGRHSICHVGKDHSLAFFIIRILCLSHFSYRKCCSFLYMSMPGKRIWRWVTIHGRYDCMH